MAVVLTADLAPQAATMCGTYTDTQRSPDRDSYGSWMEHHQGSQGAHRRPVEREQLRPGLRLRGAAQTTQVPQRSAATAASADSVAARCHGGDAPATPCTQHLSACDVRRACKDHNLASHLLPFGGGLRDPC